MAVIKNLSKLQFPSNNNLNKTIDNFFLKKS